jgi:hypothetical protein
MPACTTTPLREIQREWLGERSERKRTEKKTRRGDHCRRTKAHIPHGDAGNWSERIYANTSLRSDLCTTQARLSQVGVLRLTCDILKGRVQMHALQRCSCPFTEPLLSLRDWPVHLAAL